MWYGNTSPSPVIMPPVAIALNITSTPASCASITFSAGTFYRGQVSLLGDSACYPPSYTNVFGTSYYSAEAPSSICPTAWTTAATAYLTHFQADFSIEDFKTIHSERVALPKRSSGYEPTKRVEIGTMPLIQCCPL
jgi:hypothetical protein